VHRARAVVIVCCEQPWGLVVCNKSETQCTVRSSSSSSSGASCVMMHSLRVIMHHSAYYAHYDNMYYCAVA
jgi:hypothetical protein